MGINDNRKFVILTKEEYNELDVDWGLLLSDEPGYSTDGSKVFLKYTGEIPDFLKGYSSFTYYDFKPTFDKEFLVETEDERPKPDDEEE